MYGYINIYAFILNNSGSNTFVDEGMCAGSPENITLARMLRVKESESE